MDLRDRRRRRPAAIARCRGKVHSRAGAVSQACEGGHMELPDLHVRRQPHGKRVRVLSERHQDAGYQKLRAEFERASIEHREIELRSNTAMVLEERRDSKATAHLLFRGMYDQPRELLEAATPSFLPPMAPDLPRNRLGLARWIVDRSNPLFARVTVNRFWQEFFGAGLLESADDFGAQAQPPSHPELLDWLAVEFRESGWDVKQLMALIVTSAAYRQSAVISQDKLRSDPNNVLLARGPRFR